MKPNVLLYSPGLGYINRGLETFTRELYNTLKQTNTINLTLFQGTGEKVDGAIPVWAPKRNASIYNLHPFRCLRSKSYRIECMIFSIPIVFHCYLKKSQIVHFSEALPANVLYRLRRRIGGSFKLLFSNGGPMSPEQYRRYEYLHVLTPSQKQEAIDTGYPADSIFFIPYGLNCQQFMKKFTKSEITHKRREWKVPVDRKVVLSVGAINTSHKRMDWLINEFSKLDPDNFFLWVVGEYEAETDAVISLAKSVLKDGSYKFSTAPYSKMVDIYNLSDYFVLCSLGEGFGRVYIEAMASGLPVITHKNVNTEWIMGVTNMGLIDMTINNALGDLLIYFKNNSQSVNDLGLQNSLKAYQTFDWKNLTNQYLSMYNRLLLKN